MPVHASESIRTLALVGHAGAGKTTLAEALLFRAGAIKAMGSVERGTTVCDFDPLEKAAGHSLNSSLVHFSHEGVDVHLVDTPGYPDLAGQSVGALAAVDMAAIVVNAQNGIELSTRRMMKWAAARGLCRMVIINKIDAENVDPAAVLRSVQEAFGRECLPINLPSQAGRAVVDCFFRPEGEADFSSVREAHSALVDQVVEVDDDLMALYLEQGEEISPEQLHGPFEKALREGHLVPVCFASAKNGAGVAELLEIIDRLVPSPAEGNPPPFYRGEPGAADAEAFHAKPDASAHVLAHVFKIVVDPYVGKLGIFRVHQGTVRKDAQLFVGGGKRPFRVAHLYLLQGKDYVETEALVPGDIGAVAKVEEVEFDAVLHDSHEADTVHLRPLAFPRPMHGLAVEPKRKGDEQRIFEVLHKLEIEDPCFEVERHPTTHETVIRGLGELHLRGKLEKMANQYKLEVTTAPPRVPYRETITRGSEGHCRHKKQTGGAGQFGEVYLRVEPRSRGEGFEFVDAVKGGVIPSVFMPAVEKGVRAALDEGVIAGYPVHDVRVTVYDGKSHPVDGKEIAFITAGRKAVIEAVLAAGPIVLEPIVNIDINTPEAYVGDLASDLSGRRGQVTGTDAASDAISITGQVPLSELGDYASRLKSVTGGAGAYQIEFSHYAPVPPQVQTQLAAQYRRKEED